RRLRRDSGTQTLEDAQLQFQNTLVGAEDFLFVLFQRRGDETLAAGDRLLAVIVGGYGMKIRFRNLDVVPEHAVVTNFERGDAGADALTFLHLDDDLLAGSADRAERVEV